jgi:hypothetical protein
MLVILPTLGGQLLRVVGSELYHQLRFAVPIVLGTDAEPVRSWTETGRRHWQQVADRAAQA